MALGPSVAECAVARVRLRSLKPSKRNYSMQRPGHIWIETYERVRDGKIQQVTSHWRRLPHRRASVRATYPLVA